MGRQRVVASRHECGRVAAKFSVVAGRFADLLNQGLAPVKDFPDGACWVARGQGAGRYVPCNDAAGADHRTITDGDPLCDNYAGADQDVVTDDDRSTYRPSGAFLVYDLVEVGIKDLDEPGHLAVRTDGEQVCHVDRAPRAEERAFADDEDSRIAGRSDNGDVGAAADA